MRFSSSNKLMSVFSSIIFPLLTENTFLSNNPAIARPVIVFPDPDSPTMPSVSPLYKSILISLRIFLLE